MTIDITNPEHVRALRSAVDLATEPAFAAVSTYCVDMAKAADPPVKLAFEALSDPAKAAVLIRQLVERAGVAAYEHDPGDAIRYPCVLVNVAPPEMLLEFWDSYTVEPHTWASVADTQAPSVIARLLALQPNAGAEAVLAALRSEG